MKRSSLLRDLCAGGTAFALALGTPAVVSGQEAARSVSVTKPERATIDRAVRLVGTVLPWQSTMLRSRVTGYVASVEVLPGDRVEKGGVLCTLDLPALRAERAAAQAAIVEAEARVKGRTGDIQAARADVLDTEAAEKVAESRIAVREAARDVAGAEARLAQVVLDRKRTLFEANAATQEEVEEAQGEVDSSRARELAAIADVAMAIAELEAAKARTQAAKARVEGAEAQVAGAEAAVDTARATFELVSSRLAFGTLVSPYDDALITNRYVDPGALAKAEETDLLMIMDVSRVRLQIHVPERVSRIVRKGTRVVVTMDDSIGERVEGTVARVAGALATDSRTMSAEIDLDNSAGAFYPGMFFHARVSVETIENALLLPGSAVHTDRKQNYVLVVDDAGFVSRSNITIGVDDGMTVEILDGLEGNEQVVRALVAGLRAGDTVRAVQGSRP